MSKNPKHVAPSFGARRFSCAHCEAFADHRWYKVHCDRADPPKGPEAVALELKEHLSSPLPSDEVGTKTFNTRTRILEKAIAGDLFFKSGFCSNNAVQLVNAYVSNCVSCEENTIWVAGKIIFPTGLFSVQPNSDLPDDIRKDFEEARAILDNSPRGATALLRLCVQKLLEYLQVPGATIDQQIASLVKQGLDVRIQQSLDIVRVVGNESVHPGTMDLRDGREIASVLFDLVNRIAYDRITHPTEVERLYSSLPQSKLDGISKRDGPR